jgi:hypothetical protein
MGGRRVPHSNWEYGEARTNLPGLQPLLEVIRGLLQKGLTGEDILQTSLSHGIQSLHQ